MNFSLKLFIVFLNRDSSLLFIASVSSFSIFAANSQHKLHLPSIYSRSVEVSSFKDQFTLKFFAEKNLPQTQHQCFGSFSLKGSFEIGHSVVLSWAAIKEIISGWVVKSFAVCPLEFLHSNKTPIWRYFLKMLAKLDEAVNITLLLPKLSISSQCRPVLIKSCMMSRLPLKEAQCRGLGRIYLVLPMTTLRYYGLDSRYCWAAPLEIKSLTSLIWPRQQAQMKAVHFFLLFSEWLNLYINN